MISHNPCKTLESLREHLARHDRPLAFLFGAGTSSAVNVAPPPAKGEKPGYRALIPAVVQLTSMCKEAVLALGGDYPRAWEMVERECTPTSSKPNIEHILSRIRAKLDAIGPEDILLGLDKTSLQTLEDAIRLKIAQVVTPDNLANLSLPHEHFAHWLKQTTRNTPVEVFTTNYDILFEKAFETARLPVFDGFVGCHEPFFLPDCLEREDLLPGRSWLRLWKIHGSVNWHLTCRLDGNRITRGMPDGKGEMILPSHRKYDESRKQPYLSLLDRLTKILDKDQSLLITSGFSFGDEHINQVIFSALEKRPLTHVIALQFDNLAENAALVAHAKRRKNLIVLCRNGAVIRGQPGTWRLTEPVDESLASFVDVAFDSDACPDEDTQSLTGQLRLGDFNRFCKFLSAMDIRNEGGI